MKKETFEKKIRPLLRKDGKLKVVYEEVISWLVYHPSAKARPFTWRNYGRSARDFTQYYWDVLSVLNIDYNYGNDAPRGGKEGNYIVLTKKGQRRIKEIRLWMQQLL